MKSRRALLSEILFASTLLVACGEAKQSPAPAPQASATSPSPPPAPPTPIDGALPVGAPGALTRRAACAKDTVCTLAHLVPDEVRPALSDGAPAVIWEQVIAERATIAFPRDEGVELMGVVLDGSVDLTPLDATSKTSVGGRWTAFRAPGGGISLTGAGGKAARIALVVAVTGSPWGSAPHLAAGSLGAHVDARDKPGAPPGWKVRRKRIDVVDFDKAADLTWGGRAYHARIGWEASVYRHGEAGPTGSKTWEVDDRPAAVLSLIRFSSDAPVAEHVHEKEWEILAILEGDGELVRKLAEPEHVEVRSGALVSLSPGTRHAWNPSGKTPLFALQVYAPPGPEQRFKKLAAP